MVGDHTGRRTTSGDQMRPCDFTVCMNNGTLAIRPTSTGRAKSLVETPTDVVGEADSRAWLFGYITGGCPFLRGDYETGRLVQDFLVSFGFKVEDVGMGMFVPCSNGPDHSVEDRFHSWDREKGYSMEKPIPMIEALTQLLLG